MFFQKSFIIAALAGLAVANDVKFIDCGHHEITKLAIDGCSGDQCAITRGSTLKMSGSFVANQDSDKIKIELSAAVSGIKVPVPGIDTDGCKHAKCPVKKGETVSFTYSMAIPKELPAVKGVVVQAKLVGDHGELACGAMKGDVN